MLQAQRADGTPVKDYETIVDFRGDEWVYLGPIRAREPGKSGKVAARPLRGDMQQEFYDRVFGLIVVDV